MDAQVQRPVEYPLSSQQCAVHTENWRDSASAHVLLLEGPSEEALTEMLKGALDRMIERHEILRTCYCPVAGLRYPVQHVLPAMRSVWKSLARADDDLSLIQAARSLVNPRKGPIVGAASAEGRDGRLRWALAAPAYSVDARALQELAAACVKSCRRHASEIRAVDDVIQYPDYVAWQSELRESEIGSDARRYWDNQAALNHGMPRLPFETGRANEFDTAERFELTPEAEAAVVALAEYLRLRVDIVIAALWSGFMARVLQTNRLSIDWHTDTRTDELHGALGCFDLQLPVALQFNDEMSVSALVRSTAEQLERAASWQDCFDAAAHADRLIALGGRGHGLEFSYVSTLALPEGWACRRIELASSEAALRCVCFEVGGRHGLQWQGTVSQVQGTLYTWTRQFMAFVESAGRDFVQRWTNLPLLGAAEREWILHAAGPLRQRSALGHGRSNTLHGLFETQAQQAPDSIAVVCGDERLSYRALNFRADAMARRLRTRSVGSEQRVGIHLGRSVDTIVAMLAVLKSGAAYVPLDPSYPAQRIDDMIAGAGIATVIGSESDRARFSQLGVRLVFVDEPGEGGDGAVVATKIAPDQLAYVIYTSGSTGKPKGVMISHANAVASTLARFSFYQAPAARFLLLSSPSFDSSVAGIYWTLSQGGTLYLPTEGLQHDASYLARMIARESISTLLALPSLYKQILDSLDDVPGLSCCIVAGEASHGDIVELHRRKVPAVALVNEYGPTEGTVWSNAFQIDSDSPRGMRIPIGRPIDSMYGYVLDEQLEICAIGSAGEWYIGGDGIARGYLEQPALTAQRFVADPSGRGQRLYRTGDRARLRPDLAVEYLGRSDNQIKLRGFRIELDEIESALRSHRHVSDAAVMVHDVDDRGAQLAAFFVAKEGATGVEPASVRENLLAHLKQTLPAFMVPTLLLPVTSLPLMANGKLDRRALTGLLERASRAPYVPPADEIESTLAQIWQSVLKIERIGVKDNFFALGGHSLLVAQVSSRIRQALSVEIALKDIFETGTLGELAGRVRERVEASGDEVAAMESIMAGEG